MALTRINNNSLSNVTSAGIPIREGQILQTKVTTLADAGSWTSSNSSFEVVSGLAVTITPTASTSTFLLMATISVATESGQRSGAHFARGTTPIGVANASGSKSQGQASWAVGSNYHPTVISMIHEDDPDTTDAITYNIYFSSEGSRVGRLNRTWAAETDNATYYRGVSRFIVQEIAGS